MNPQIKQAIERGELVLLLGAGVSLSSLNSQNTNVLGGRALAEALLKEASVPFEGEFLPVAYSAAKQKMGDRLWPFMEKNFLGCKPSLELNIIAKFPWARIYTINIDDALDKALHRTSPQNVVVRYRFDRLADRDPFYNRLDYVKLNGSIDRRADGLIFSPQEYGVSSAAPPHWYRELSNDFFRYIFLFIGTKLAEPLFYHQIESYRKANAAMEGRSFVLTPSATAAEALSLSELNLQHIPGTLADFAQWLDKSFDRVPSPRELAIAQHPELGAISKNAIEEEHLSLLDSVLKVSRRSLSPIADTARPSGAIRDFYRGFKPTWNDILAEVPAVLELLSLVAEATSHVTKDKRIVVVTGPAGSGKTTLLMQVALKLADTDSTRPVYYLTEPVDAVDRLIDWLEKISTGPFILCIDRASIVTDGLKRAMNGGRIRNCILVLTERQNVWNQRVRPHLGNFVASQHSLQLLTKGEAEAILEKLERFGPWTRLAKLSEKARLNELLTKAKRQLLIALLETTSGRGFEKIIEDDFAELSNRSQKLFVAIVGLATIHRLPMQISLLQRALASLHVNEGVDALMDATVGIVGRSGDRISARHQIYIEYLFERVLPKEDKAAAVHALLSGFSAYESPLLVSVGRVAATLFKLTINHRFLRNAFQSDQRFVLGVYEAFEKTFQSDGLFWLQYGLALRDFDMQGEALDRLRTAKYAYPGLQTEHALAQQQLIIASRPGCTREEAFAMLDEAKEALLRLDARRNEFESDYPIVTLSEGHVTVVNFFDGGKPARILAKSYANELAQRMKIENENARLRDAWKRLSFFSTGGPWRSERELLFGR